jgi:hypothetical protein
MEFSGHSGVAKPKQGDANGWEQITCGHCGHKVTGAVIALLEETTDNVVKWVQCPGCGWGTVINVKDGVETRDPGSHFGPEVEGLPEDVKSTYREARDCFRVSAFTACELLCRKILMHVAVDKGAKEGDKFEAYITFLESKGYVTPPMKDWVDLIRTNANKSTHRLAPPSREQTESTLMFTAELLRLVYEMAAMASKYARPATT